MQINEDDLLKSNEELQGEANGHNVSEERVKQILAVLLIKTVKDWQNPQWFMEWAKTTPDDEAQKFLADTMENIITLEMYELCSAVEQMIGQLNAYYALNKHI